MTPLDCAIHTLVREVSEGIILPRFRRLEASDIVAKAADDVVTIADREAESRLAEELALFEPGIAIVGEEATHADPALTDALSGDCWIVDPLDGTNNFAAGKAPFGILIARASGGSAVSGWIYDCLSGRFCVAHRGRGATRDGEPVSATGTGEQKPVAAISTIFMDEARRAAVKAHIAPHYRLVDIPR